MQAYPSISPNSSIYRHTHAQNRAKSISTIQTFATLGQTHAQNGLIMATPPTPYLKRQIPGANTCPFMRHKPFIGHISLCDRLFFKQQHFMGYILIRTLHNIPLYTLRGKGITKPNIHYYDNAY